MSVKLRSDCGVLAGTIFIPFCSEAVANLLTNPALDPMGNIREFKFCAARVTPAMPAKISAE
ncbi:hypothetical protein [Methylobacterium nigriterrae]|uniref:hypothetical protein n=1 Tax=Methylobacterium nigriterrae TaxID=3127512 RepID=UPI003013A9E6